ncbi:MAG: hypothetical protein M3R24_15330 [Chloroflexota bacterium]|nr:hypothetical protein [Chloroflexota bacterium]
MLNTPAGGTPQVAPQPVVLPAAVVEAQPVAAAPVVAAPAPVRNQVVAGVTDEEPVEAVANTAARPRALLDATGLAGAETWLLLTLGFLLVALGAVVRVLQLRRP